MPTHKNIKNKGAFEMACYGNSNLEVIKFLVNSKFDIYHTDT